MSLPREPGDGLVEADLYLRHGKQAALRSPAGHSFQIRVRGARPFMISISSPIGDAATSSCSARAKVGPWLLARLPKTSRRSPRCSSVQTAAPLYYATEGGEEGGASGSHLELSRSST